MKKRRGKKRKIKLAAPTLPVVQVTELHEVDHQRWLDDLAEFDLIFSHLSLKNAQESKASIHTCKRRQRHEH